jgi:hypothetical protein
MSAQAAKGGCKVAGTAMGSRAQRVRCALFLEKVQAVFGTISPRKTSKGEEFQTS